jgi:hypothetical protein
MDEKNAFEEIAFIKKVMQDSRRSVLMHGKDYIMWGIVVSIGFLLTYILSINQYKLNYITLWMIIIGIGYIIEVYFVIKEKKFKRSRTYSEKLMSAVWGAAGITMCILGFLGSYVGAIRGAYVAPVLATITGIGSFLTALILNQKYMKYFSSGWWVGSIFMFIFPGWWQMLLMAIMMIAFQVIPGIFIYRNFKKETSVNNG